ncbi:MAG: tRNA uridine-5-carboxymethylaminomethyl(34) synthesis GTPase MnmE [Clostridia bacterium]|nr:tRNA uridine-5-carboxymethylaminomethyl(34) synthesis GTPase MnmE [Clostridia bacterium]
MSAWNDTVAAVSTPRGKGGIAVIRISGEDCAAVLGRVFRPKGKSPAQHPRRACFGALVDAAGEVLDEVLVTYFGAPRSFTGEDVAEIACHGGTLVTESVLGAVLAAGARPATAGEFTRRALLNGKMKLSEAEALGALLDADTAGRLALARGGMSGKLAAAIEGQYETLARLLADLYAKIDFPDEDLNTMSEDEWLAALCEVRARIVALSATWRTGRAVAEGIATVICGPVNAGKSTLYNALVGRDAAIVTDVAGTTRDILSETVALGNLTLRLSDTAGLRETADAVEGIGVSRARQAMEEAELILAVFDGARPWGEAEQALLADLQTLTAPVIAVVNKSDREAAFSDTVLGDFTHVVHLSAKDGEIGALRSAVEQLFLDGALDLRHDAVVSNARQYAALTRAAEQLDRAIAALTGGILPDAVSSDVELAMSALGEVDGRAVSEDVVANIFSHFCVGK